MEKIGKQEFNTNNSWGFGGAIYTRTFYNNDVAIDNGYSYYRHLKRSPFRRLLVKDGMVWCEVNKPMDYFNETPSSLIKKKYKIFKLEHDEYVFYVLVKSEAELDKWEERRRHFFPEMVLVKTVMVYFGSLT